MRGSKSSVFPESLYHTLWFWFGYLHYGLRCVLRFLYPIQIPHPSDSKDFIFGIQYIYVLFSKYEAQPTFLQLEVQNEVRMLQSPQQEAAPRVRHLFLMSHAWIARGSYCREFGAPA